MAKKGGKSEKGRKIPPGGPARAGRKPGTRATPAPPPDPSEFVSIGFFTLSAAGRVRDASSQGGRLLGRDRRGLTGHPFVEFVALSSRDAFREHLRDALRTGTSRRTTLRMDSGRGRFFWAFVESVVRPSEDGSVIRVAVTDITERVLAEQDSARLISAVEQAGESIVIIQPEGTITYANRAFEAINGVGRAQAVDKSYFKLLAPITEGPEWPKNPIGAIARGGSWAGRVVRRAPDGGKRILLLSLSPIKAAAGQIFNYLVTERDITREAELEENLHQIQKFEAVGTLAAGIAHDLNNSLGPIILNTEMNLLDRGESEDARQRNEVILRAAERAKGLVRQLLTITSRRKGLKAPFRLSALLRELFSFIRASLPSTVEIRMSGMDTDGFVFADRGQIEQIFLNLANNAAYAMRDAGGVLSVDAARIKVDTPPESGLAGLKPGPYLRVTVSDTGPGVDPAILDRIFDPFFTTKPAGEGTGLGLSVVRGIVEAHDGLVIGFNDPVRGAVFSVFLPETEQTEEAAADMPPLLGGNSRILLVDDEELQILSWKLALERLGYRVSSTTSSEDALGLFLKAPDEFDLMITDQTMPRLTGFALAKEVLRVRPGFPVILCTGYSDTVSPERARQAGIRIFLKKPLGLLEMADAVLKALSRDESGRAPAVP